MTIEAFDGHAGPSARRPAPRAVGVINGRGLATLITKEVRRFLKVPAQTIFAPAMTTLLFLAIFTLALGRGGREVAGLPFPVFMAPGLIMMAIIQNAFANTTSSIMTSKVQGNIVDMLLPPFRPSELALAFALGGVARGVLVAAAVGLAIAAFVPTRIQHWGALLFYPLAAALLLSLVGIATAIWAEKFDHMAAITNFIVTPLSFLSGTFYTIDRLPEPWHALSLANPIFYMIDGMRYALTGHADGSIAVGVAVLAAGNALLWWLVHHMFASGYKLKE